MMTRLEILLSNIENMCVILLVCLVGGEQRFAKEQRNTDFSMNYLRAAETRVKPQKA